MVSKKNLPLIFFFGFSLILSLIIFLGAMSRVGPPSPIEAKFTESLLPSFKNAFNFRYNDFRYYALGVASFLIIPLVLFSLIKLFRAFVLLFLLPLLFFFRFPTLYFGYFLGIIGNAAISFQRSLLLIAILAVVIAYILKSLLKLKIKLFNYRFWKHITYLFIFITIFILIYNPKYPYSYQSLSLYGSIHQFLHANFYIAPINEVINGKSLLVDAHAQYGILTTYFPSLIFKIIGLSYANFVLYTMILAVIYAIIFFLLLRVLSKNSLLALIGILAYIKLAYYRGIDPGWEAFVLPSSTPLRYFFDILVAFLVFNFFKIGARPFKKLLLVSGVAVLALFYNPEFGLPVFIAYGAALATDLVLAFINKEKGKDILSKSLKYLFSLEIAVIAVVGIISFLTWVRSGVLPDWGGYLNYIFFYAQGFNDAPMPIWGLYYLPLLTYLIGYYYLLTRIYHHQPKDVQLLIFLVSYGLMIFVYYINLSETHHLLTVIHPSILIIFVLIGHFKDDLKGKLPKISFLNAALPILFFLLAAKSVFGRPNDVVDLIMAKLNYRYHQLAGEYHYWSYPGTNFYLDDNKGTDFFLAANRIKALSGKEKNVIILSRYDTLLYVMSQKASLIDYPIIDYEIIKKTEFYLAIKKILEVRPQYIFLYSSKYSQRESSAIDLIWTAIGQNYSLAEHAGVIDVYKLN